MLYMRDLKILPLFEEVSDTEDVAERVTSSDIVDDFTKDAAYKVFSGKMNDAVSLLDKSLSEFCAAKYDDVDADELQDAKERLISKIVKQYM